MKALMLLVLSMELLAVQGPKEGKVRIHVIAGEPRAFRGAQQRASELEESARDLRRHLGKAKWLELTEDAELADIRLRVLGRREDPDKGNVLGYSLDAGAYQTEDEYAYIGETEETGGGRGLNTSFTPRKVLGWGELARRFAQSLDGFAESNYDRIVSQRK